MAPLFDDEALADMNGWSESSHLVRGLYTAERYVDAVKAALLEGDLQMALLVWDWRRPCYDECMALLDSAEFGERAPRTAVEALAAQSGPSAGPSPTWRDVLEELDAILAALNVCKEEIPYELVLHLQEHGPGGRLPLGLGGRTWSDLIEIERRHRDPESEVQRLD